ncbi:MAG: MGH1-like glycoside hydrolase domain-containing protein [Solirubrobacterales bacterium]
MSGARLGELCRGVLEASWAEGERRGIGYAYTRPSPWRYPWQWYWDSCFTAVAWRRFDAARSRAELETLLAAMRDDGFIGHVVFWERPLSYRRRAYYNVRSRRDEMTGTIQPPLLAWAWRVAVGDPVAEPRIARHHHWLERERDLEGDGLLWIVQPDESGLDASPKFDPVWGRRSHTRSGFPLLVARNRRLGWQARAIRDRGWPVLCEVSTNVLWCLARIAAGQPSITPALVDRLWDERRGLFLDEVQPGGARPAISTWAALAPLALPDLPEEIGHRLVDEHLLDRRRYWLEVPPASVSAEEPSFEPNRGPGLKRRYWRGPTWVNAAWLLWLGLCRLGYDEPAREMATALEAAVLREGLREYYDPHTGAGLGARDFAWTSLVLELADPDPRATRSYL